MADPAALALLVLAALAAGALNAVAGGGSFFTFPALVLAGVPAVPANATSAVALWPASVASAAAFREDLKHPRRTLWVLGGVSLLGGLLGALLLLLTPERAFEGLVPWLLLVATLVFAFGPRLTAALRARDLRLPLAGMALVQLLVATYGGYFGGGMGIMMLAAFAAMGMEDLNAMNGLKAILGVLLNGVAIAAFVAGGVVAWTYCLP
ncbi:MAG TPA: sulfite exporter TauE/SafE family protein, partial [Candidatus Thermoplasmatota archaeon]|nr:sulfite exporter TauE/SafE family protein [Candidatus Thermoplasmatota archaeon]